MRLPDMAFLDEAETSRLLDELAVGTERCPTKS